MTRLLIFDAAWKRVAGELAPFKDRLQVLLVDRDGQITLDGKPCLLYTSRCV